MPRLLQRHRSPTAETIRDGWLKTGDSGTLEDGFVYYYRSQKELIITSGGKKQSLTAADRETN